MIDFKKVERIAAALEQQLGIEVSENEQIKNAKEAAKDDLIVEEIDKAIADEKKEEGVDNNPHNESPLQADDESEASDIEKKIADAEVENPANIEQTMDEEADDENEEIDPYEAQACIASLKRLIRIAKAVKKAKDIPATKKEEVLGKIQKASEKLRKAGAKENNSENDEQDTSDNLAVQTFINIFLRKRGKINGILNGRGQGTKIIRAMLGNKGFDNKVVGNMTLTELFNTMSSVLSKLK